MFDRSFRHADHVRHYSIHPVEGNGWEVRFEEDRELRRHELYRDWHRVERALALFEMEAARLQELGWLIVQ